MGMLLVLHIHHSSVLNGKAGQTNFEFNNLNINCSLFILQLTADGNIWFIVDLIEFVAKLKKRAGGDAGMILIHNGIVRNSSRDGRPVESIEVKADLGKLSRILADTLKLPGITAAEAEIQEGRLGVGEDIMFLGVAGDTRENVIPALASTLDRIKKEVTRKQEFSE
jgi:molybdopterin synthase catalytic subunit